MSEQLFIGGSNDGKRFEVDEHSHYFRLPVRQAPPSFSVGDFEPAERSVSYENYVRLQFSLDGNPRSVFRLESLSIIETFDMLVDGYGPPGGYKVKTSPAPMDANNEAVMAALEPALKSAAEFLDEASLDDKETILKILRSAVNAGVRAGLEIGHDIAEERSKYWKRQGDWNSAVTALQIAEVIGNRKSERENLSQNVHKNGGAQ